MEKFSDDEANLIMNGLNRIVKDHGLERPDLYQMAHGIVGKLQAAAKVDKAPVEE